jgi:hypothetical protein
MENSQQKKRKITSCLYHRKKHKACPTNCQYKNVEMEENVEGIFLKKFN